MITPVPFNAGGSSRGCLAYGVGQRSSATLGFFYVVGADAGMSFDIEPPIELEFKGSGDGGVVGFADTSGGPSPSLVSVSDEAGVEVPCEQ